MKLLLKYFFVFCFLFLISFPDYGKKRKIILFEKYRGDTLSKARIDAINREIFELVRKYYSPEDYFPISKDISVRLIQVYSCIEKKKELLSLSGKEQKEFMENLFFLYKTFHEHSAAKLWTGKYRVSIKGIISTFSFNFNKSYEETLKWWNKYGKTHNRKEWGIYAVNNILKKKSLSLTDKMCFVFITGNYRIYIYSKKQIIEWWKEIQLKTPREWALDSLGWAIMNLDNKDKNVQVIAVKCLLYNLDYRIIERCLSIDRDEVMEKIHKDKRPFEKTVKIFLYNIIIEGKKKLLKWYNNNLRNYNPWKCERWDGRNSIEILSNW